MVSVDSSENPIDPKGSISTTLATPALWFSSTPHRPPMAGVRNVLATGGRI
ncbi:hypothetical protein T11_14512 [Trichinella zimbabwensis]|uniref:Uncharacterized protein n=1 Tax=Trichinella zimbabwensis TaxID=268475 RepID=A0A0V1GF38_9BILA|nr:hypothetical protein T11_14512 [Trichinella zimbabwensis]